MARFRSFVAPSLVLLLCSCSGTGTITIFNESDHWAITNVNIDSDEGGNLREDVDIAPGESVSYEVDTGVYDVLIQELSLQTGSTTGDGVHDIDVGSGGVELETDDAGGLELRE